MNPDRKRLMRLSTALAAAVVLAAALAYTSFSASSEAKTPSELLRSAKPGHSYQLTGKVLPGYQRHGDLLSFRVRARAGTPAVAVPVVYRGEVPDPFRAGREVIVTVRKQGNVFAGQRDSLITKCPSKFKAAGSA